ncbi:hypothetical protein CYMTET_46835 [Cymbomonas tetramitiformis]|uniref:Uncharacterized protein n=1 Tax=Cymbomonas tetramitiformis TaxID=36881 RepID=A0AAE0EX87_9CHLO|nr:hypothetical protein CYMTET_46835 [Cymbomonas tetramitiformis]
MRRRSHAQGAALVQQKKRGWRELLDPPLPHETYDSQEQAYQVYEDAICAFASTEPRVKRAPRIQIRNWLQETHAFLDFLASNAGTPGLYRCHPLLRAIQRYGQHLWPSQQGTSQSLPGLSNRVAAYPVPRHLLCELFNGLTF